VQYIIKMGVRIIWLLWLQGWRNAPLLARECASSWRRLNPHWTVVLLDGRNLHEHLNLAPTLSPIFWNLTRVRPAAASDLVRVHLMEQRGGVWVDSSAYCMQPIDNWLWKILELSGGFWVHQMCAGRVHPHVDVNSWFMASAARAHPLATRWLAFAQAFWTPQAPSRSPATHREADAGSLQQSAASRIAKGYFWMDDLFVFLHALDRTTREMWAQMACLHPAHAASGLHDVPNATSGGIQHPFHAWRAIAPSERNKLRTSPPFFLKLSLKLPHWTRGLMRCAKALWLCGEATPLQSCARVTGDPAIKQACGQLERYIAGEVLLSGRAGRLPVMPSTEIRTSTRPGGTEAIQRSSRRRRWCFGRACLCHPTTFDEEGASACRSKASCGASRVASNSNCFDPELAHQLLSQIAANSTNKTRLALRS
jgi:hypothetical protein